jgi:hypothetical protein
MRLFILGCAALTLLAQPPLATIKVEVTSESGDLLQIAAENDWPVRFAALPYAAIPNRV